MTGLSLTASAFAVAPHTDLFLLFIACVGVKPPNWPIAAACSAAASILIWWLLAQLLARLRRRQQYAFGYRRVSRDIETGVISDNDSFVESSCSSSSSLLLFSRDTLHKCWLRRYHMLRNALYYKGMLQHVSHVMHNTGDKLDVLEAYWQKCSERDVLPMISDTEVASKVSSSSCCS